MCQLKENNLRASLIVIYLKKRSKLIEALYGFQYAMTKSLI